ncbi:hypothetical protein Tco_0111543 [Tanacetum coccineum]
MAWTTSDTIFESTDFLVAQALSPTDSLMQDDSIPDEQVHLSDDEDSEMITYQKLTREKTSGNHYLKRKYQRLLNIPGPFLLSTNWRHDDFPEMVMPTSEQDHAYTELIRRAMVYEVVNSIPNPYGPFSFGFPDGGVSIRSSQNSPTQDTGMTTLAKLSSEEPITKNTPLGKKRIQETSGWKNFQLGIESYQTQLNLTKPGWDATGYEFNHDYTIIESPRAVVFLVNNNERKIMRFNEIYKFSDGTLTRILEVLAYRVKEFKIKRLNLAAIERRLKMRRIYQNLECFIGGRVHDIDYRLLQRIE